MNTMSESELLAEIKRNDKLIVEAQKAAANLSRRNMQLQSELNRRRNSQAFSGFPIGHIFCFTASSKR